jgi:hypothetical protein
VEILVIQGDVEICNTVELVGDNSNKGGTPPKAAMFGTVSYSSLWNESLPGYLLNPVL